MNIFKYLIFIILIFTTSLVASETTKKKLIYITPDTTIPFWQIMAKGIKNVSTNLNYDLDIYNSDNNAKNELVNTVKAIKQDIAGIIVSPTNSSACVTILKLAKKANIPVVIADIGTDSGEYVSYISSNNKAGAYAVGKYLTERMKELNLQDGKVGIIAISQKRLNGQERTAGFMKALDEANIKGATIKQMHLWTYKEAYEYTKNMILQYPDLKAIWVQTSNIYPSILDAVKDFKKEDDLLIVAFDAEPEFLQMIPKNEIIASGMQQPYLMGEHAALAMHKHLNNEVVEKNIQIPILMVSNKNIASMLDKIYLNVLGIQK